MPNAKVSYLAACTLLYNVLSKNDALTQLDLHLKILSGHAFKSSEYSSDGVRLLRNINLQTGYVDWTETAYYPQTLASSFEKFNLCENDLVVSMDGTVTRRGIKIAFLKKEDLPALLLQRVCKLDVSPSLDKQYLAHMLHTQHFVEHLLTSNRSIAIPHVSAKQIGAFKVPIIDLAVQKRVGQFLTAIAEESFLQKAPDLPRDLIKQQRTIEKLEHLASKIEEARGLRGEIERDIQRTLFSAQAGLSEGAKFSPMSEVAPLVRRKVEVVPDDKYPELGVRSFGKGTFFKPALPGSEVGNKKLYRIEEDDLIFQIVFAWEGAVAVAKPEDTGRVGSHRFLTCVPKESAATSNYLRYYFLSPEGLEKLGKASPGGAGRNRTLAMKALAAIEVPVPPIEQQKHFDLICKKFENAKQLQAQTRGELDALLPSVLDKAFRGEL